MAALSVALVVAATANSATHTYNDYHHGIVWDYQCCAGDLRSFIRDVDGGSVGGRLWAYGYHYTSIGTWQERCAAYSSAATYKQCTFEAGNNKCTKWAWVAGDDFTGGDLSWHGHNPADGC